MPDFTANATDKQTSSAMIDAGMPGTAAEVPAGLDFSGAFHWQNGIFFQRIATGIRIILPESIAAGVYFDVPWADWQSIVHYASQGPRSQE